MGMLDRLTDGQFAKDENGKLVFLPRGPRRTAYFFDFGDEKKIKSLVKIYAVALMLINMTGSTAAIAITLWLAFDEHSTTLAHKLKFGAVVYLISASLLYYGPALLLWNVYRGAVDGVCSSLTSFDPGSIQLMYPPSNRRAGLILIIAGLLIFILGMAIAVSYRR